MITIQNSELNTNIILLLLVLGIFFTINKKVDKKSILFDKETSLELRGMSAIFIIFSHIAHLVVTNDDFLYPLRNIASVGSDLFLFISGYWLTSGLLKKEVSIIEFYKTRSIKIFKTLWIVLTFLFLMDYFLLNKEYELFYIIRSYFAIFPSAYADTDISSPMWYLSWLLMFYILLPIFFMKNKLWLTSLILAIISSIIGIYNVFDVQANWLHKIHTLAFPLGIFVADIIFKHKNNKNTFIYINLLSTKLKEKLNFLSKIIFHVKKINKNILNYSILIFIFLTFAYIVKNKYSFETEYLIEIPNYIKLQVLNLILMFLLLIFFLIKNFNIKLFSYIGNYSYQIYLLHLPLILRYDIFFKNLPIWLGVILWFLTLILISHIIQKYILLEKKDD